MPASLWSGNLRLSLVLIPVNLHSAVSTEDTISFRMIHEPSGQKGRPSSHQHHGCAEEERSAKGRANVTTSVRDKLANGRERLGKVAPRSDARKPVKTAH